MASSRCASDGVHMQLNYLETERMTGYGLEQLIPTELHGSVAVSVVIKAALPGAEASEAVRAGLRPPRGG